MASGMCLGVLMTLELAETAVHTWLFSGVLGFPFISVTKRINNMSVVHSQCNIQ